MRYILTGGGSGGHIYPLLSFARVVRQLDPAAEFLFVGKKNNMEAEIVPKSGIAFAPIATAGTKGLISWQNVKAASLVSLGYVQAKKIIRDFAPDVCLGGGGYVSVPLMLAARGNQAIVRAILESDQFIGKANLQLAKKSDLAFGGLFDLKERYFADANNYYHVGHPRMQELYETYPQEIDAKRTSTRRNRVLFIGGSLGAQTINEQALAFAAYLVAQKRRDISLTLITGKRYYDDVIAAKKKFDFLTVLPYAEAMGDLYLQADLLVCRASAGVLAEATTFNLPLIAIPSPNVMRNHQYYNAAYFVDRGAGLLFNEADIDQTNFATFVYDTLANAQLLQNMKNNLAKLMHKDAVTQMYMHIIETKAQKAKEAEA